MIFVDISENHVPARKPFARGTPLLEMAIDREPSVCSVSLRLGSGGGAQRESGGQDVICERGLLTLLLAYGSKEISDPGWLRVWQIRVLYPWRA